VPDGNGAGIRAEGNNLTIEKSRFINNEDGILAADAPNSTIRIFDSEFTRNGKCQNACAHGIYVGHIALLHIERTKFFETREGHHIKSRAERTELIDNDIEDGPSGTSSYLVDISNGGTLVMENNVLEKGPHSSNHSAAVVIEDDIPPALDPPVFANNSFTEDGQRSVFLLNWSDRAADFEHNSVRGPVTLSSEEGRWLHRIRVLLLALKLKARPPMHWMRTILRVAISGSKAGDLVRYLVRGGQN